MTNKLWPTVNKQTPCPICSKPDFCALGDYSVKCMREPSDKPSKDGGWYHPYGGQNPKPFLPPKKDVAEPLKDADRLMQSFEGRTSDMQIRVFSQSIGVSMISLEWLQIGYSREHLAWAFPMRDGNSNIIGIRLRNEAGDKWAVKGSRQGLFIPSYFEGDETMHDTCFICEGPTDTAAVLSLGLYAIGRPSCNFGSEQLVIALRNHKIRRVVIISDNDDKRRTDGRAWYPGLDGAKALGQSLRLPHVIWIPPTKDVREFVRSGGSKEVILSDIKQKVWKR